MLMTAERYRAVTMFPHNPLSIMIMDYWEPVRMIMPNIVRSGY